MCAHAQARIRRVVDSSRKPRPTAGHAPRRAVRRNVLALLIVGALLHRVFLVLTLIFSSLIRPIRRPLLMV